MFLRDSSCVLGLAAAALLAGGVSAAPFIAGDLAVYRVGTGTASLTSAGTPVFIDEYTPAGVLVQSIALPTSVSGANQPLFASGTATSEGLLTLSTDGRYLMLTGYASNPASVAGTTAAAVNRVVGRIDANGTIDTSTALTDFANSNNPRSVVSTNGTDIWVAGATGGVRYTTLGSTTSAQISGTLTNLRQINIFDGQLYASTSSGSAIRLGTVGAGVPKTIGQTISNLPGFVTTTTTPDSFFMADLSSTVPGLDTLYVADEDAGVTKYSLVGGNWTSDGTVGKASDNYRGLTGVVAGTTVTLYATRKGGSSAAGGGELVSLIDGSGYDGAFSATASLLATAANDEAFRGVAFVPAVPEPATLGLLGMSILTLTLRRRRV